VGTSGHKAYKFKLQRNSINLNCVLEEFQIPWLVQYYEHRTKFKISTASNKIEALKEEKSLFITNIYFCI
jgi:hypothetical protein